MGKDQGGVYVRLMKVGDICNFKEGILVVVDVDTSPRNNVVGLQILNKEGVPVNTLVGRRHTEKFLTVIENPGAQLFHLANVRYKAYKS